MYRTLKEQKIWVLAGGFSNEREISLKSGKAVLNALSGSGLDVRFFDVRDRADILGIDQKDIDVAFIALHGRFGEDGAIQTILESRHIPYTGSSPASSALAMDKLLSKKMLEKAGLKVPGYKVASPCVDPDMTGFMPPFVVKPRYGGSSIGLSIVRSEDGMAAALSEAGRYDEDIIIEEYIPGKELTVGILDGKALPVIEIVPGGGVYDFPAKYDSADTRYIVPAGISDADEERVREYGLVAHNALGCGSFSRVDLRLRNDSVPYVLEVNTIPGLTERSLLPMAALAAGMDFTVLCTRMLCLALDKYRVS